MRKSYLVLLYSISIIIFVLTIFHIGFWEIFNWKVTLASLSVDNRNIMYTLNITQIMNLFAMIIITIFFKNEVLNTKLGRFILIWFSTFYFLRVILEFTLWHSSPNLLIIVLCVFVGMVYTLPLWMKKFVWDEKR
jgi:hypothetical protein